jgi:hypothetical protein
MEDQTPVPIHSEVLDHRVFETEQTTPYSESRHAVLPPLVPVLRQLRNLGRERRSAFTARGDHPQVRQ